MKRSLIGAFGALAAMALFAQPAFASGGGGTGCAPSGGDGVFNFTFSAVGEGQGSQPLNKDGQWLCDNAGIPDLSPLNSPFNVFCVDFTGIVHEGDTYAAFATNVSTGGFAALSVVDGQADGSHTEQGVGGLRTYFNAIFLINNYFSTGGTLTGNSVDYQFAIWAITDHSDSPANCVARFGSGCNGNVQALIAMAETGAGQTAFTANPDQFASWRIITETSCGGTGGSGLGAASRPEQELVYITRASRREPASMSLLAFGLTGLAGASLRRRKRR